MCSVGGDAVLPRRVAPFGYPGITARLTAPPGFSQSAHALHRPSAPRHPPCALSSLPAPRAAHHQTPRAARPPGRAALLRIAPTTSIAPIPLSTCSGRPSPPPDRRPPAPPRGGGAGGARTPGLLRAREALSRLSYSPEGRARGPKGREPPEPRTLNPTAGGPWWTRTTGLGLIRTAL